MNKRQTTTASSASQDILIGLPSPADDHTQEAEPKTETSKHARVEQLKALETRNAELQQSQRELQLQLEQYTTLYDFAPIGYITLDREGHLLSTNLAGAEMIGMIRSRLNKPLFIKFIAKDEHSLFSSFLNKVFSDHSGTTACEVKLIKDRHSCRHVQIKGLANGSGTECLVTLSDITELRLEEQKFHIVSDNTYDWEFWLSPVGRFIYNSPACLRVTGYQPHHFQDESALTTIIHPDDQELFARHKHNFASEGQPVEVDFRIVRADGEIRWISHACKPVYDNRGDFLGARGSNRDITDRKLVEMIMQGRIRISECMFGHSVDDLLTKVLDEAENLTNSQIGFFHFIDDNQTTLTLQTWSTSTLKSMCSAEGKGHLYKIDQAGVWCDAIRERKPLIHNSYESLPHRKGLPPGHAPVTRELVVPIFRNDIIVAVLGVGNKPVNYNEQDIHTVQQLADLAWDIVERKRVEVNLMESEQRFRSLFENMNEGVALHSFIHNDAHEIVDYRIISVNDAYESILGLSRESVIGRTGCEVYQTTESPYLKEFSSVFASHHGMSFETYFPPMERHFNISVIPWGKNGFATFFSDITERKRSEQQLRQFNRSLKERVSQVVDEMRQKDQLLVMQERRAMMGEMINNIAHQWRQPLNVLALNLQDLPLAYDSPEFNKEYLKESVDNSMQLIDHMSQTIDDFRNFFKADKQTTSFLVNDVIRRTLSLVEKSFHDQQIVIAFQAGADRELDSYPNELSQALLNLLINARDALVERRPDDPKIFVQSFTEKDKSVITITDNAGGIAAEIIDRLFDPYFTTKGPDKGTGIGLFMSMAIIEKNMGGKLTVRNTGNGAEFRIEI